MEKQIFLDFNVRFNLREPKHTKQTIIYAVVSVGQKQMKFNTGVKIVPSHWDNIKCVASMRGGLTPLERYNNAICNNKLQSISFEIEKIRLYLNENYSDFEYNKFKNLFHNFINSNAPIKPKKKMKKEINATIQLKQLIENQNIKNSSKEGKKSAIKLFANWLNENNIEDTFNNISIFNLAKYEKYLISKNKKPKTIKTNFDHITSIIRYSKQLEIYPNTLNTGVENYKTTTPKLGNKQKNSKQFSLTEEEVNTLYNYNKLEGKKEEIKDCFILQIEVGQRIGDMVKIIKRDFETSADGNFIRLQQEKNNSYVSIPITQRIKEIFNKYKTGFNHINTFDEKKLTTAFSHSLSDIAKVAGLNRKHTYQEQIGDEVVKKTEPIYKIIHSHTARHTFITTQLKNGMPKDDLMTITGHADDTMINNVYSHLTQEDKEKNILKAQDKINNEQKKIQHQQNSNEEQLSSILLEKIENNAIEKEERKKEIKNLTAVKNQLSDINAIIRQHDDYMTMRFNEKDDINELINDFSDINELKKEIEKRETFESDIMDAEYDID